MATKCAVSLFPSFQDGRQQMSYCLFSRVKEESDISERRLGQSSSEKKNKALSAAYKSTFKNRKLGTFHYFLPIHQPSRFLHFGVCLTILLRRVILADIHYLSYLTAKSLWSLANSETFQTIFSRQHTCISYSVELEEFKLLFCMAYDKYN